MATTTTHAAFNSQTPHPYAGGSVSVRRLQEDATIGDAVNDVLKMFRLKRGDVVTDCLLQTGDLDTGAGIVLAVQITNGTTTKTLIDGSTVGQAGGVVRPTKIITTEDGVGFVVPDNTYWVQVKATTAAGTAQAADVLLILDIGGHREVGDLTE